MSDTQVLQIVVDMLAVATKIAAPILLLSLAIGVFISIIQTITQIQEMTLTFVPKLLGVALLLIFGGNWMLRVLVQFVTELWTSIPDMV